MPYLSFAPSAWVLPLKFTGGGYSGGGKLMFDSQGNAWIADNFDDFDEELEEMFYGSKE